VTYQETTAAIAAVLATACIAGGAATGDRVAIFCGLVPIALIPSVLNTPDDES